MAVKIINNTTEKLRDDLQMTLKKGSRMSMTASCFSVYAFQELKKQLENIEELRFIFTSPTFLDDEPEKRQREFYIPRLRREQTLLGNEFEIRLRSALHQREISEERARWIRKKAQLKSNKTMEGMSGFLAIDSKEPVAYAPIQGLTREELGCERGDQIFRMINRIDAPESNAYLELFDQLWHDEENLQDVTEKVLARMTSAYFENSPEFLYFFSLYHIFRSFLEGVSEDDLPQEANVFKDSLVLKKLYAVERFHQKLAGILNNEFEQDRNETQQAIQGLEQQQEALMKELIAVDIAPVFFNEVLTQYGELASEITYLEKQNEAWRRYKELKEEEKQHTAKHSKTSSKLSNTVSTSA